MAGPIRPYYLGASPFSSGGDPCRCPTIFPIPAPPRKLIRFFLHSRDQWKAQCQCAKATIKRLENRVRFLEKSKAEWKARGASQLEKRLRQYEEAHQTCQRAIARYDQLALLLHLLRETLYLCSPLPGEWWELLIQQVQEAEKAPDAVDRPATPPLHLWVHPEGAAATDAFGPPRERGADVRLRTPSPTR